MSQVKWLGGIAIVRASSATDAPVTGYKYPVCDSGQIEGAPILYKRTPNIVPDVDQIYGAGHDYAFSISSITPNANIFGYLAALMLGGYAYATLLHTITPANTIQYLNALIDRGLDLGTSTPTQRLVGGKITAWDLDFPQKDFAKLNVSGIGCDLGALAAALTPSIPTGVDEAPLSWASLEAGYFKVGIDGAATVQYNGMKGFKVGYARAGIPAGVGLNVKQPATIHSGIRGLTAEIAAEFDSAMMKSLYDAWKAQQAIEIEWKAVMGANYIEADSIFGKFSANLPGDVGAAEEIIAAGVSLDIFKSGTNDVMKYIVKDGTSAAYWV